MLKFWFFADQRFMIIWSFSQTWRLERSGPKALIQTLSTLCKKIIFNLAPGSPLYQGLLQNLHVNSQYDFYLLNLLNNQFEFSKWTFLWSNLRDFSLPKENQLAWISCIGWTDLIFVIHLISRTDIKVVLIYGLNSHAFHNKLSQEITIFLLLFPTVNTAVRIEHWSSWKFRHVTAF